MVSAQLVEAGRSSIGSCGYLKTVRPDIVRLAPRVLNARPCITRIERSLVQIEAQGIFQKLHRGSILRGKSPRSRK